ncbi:uncharacterized protein LOC126260685 [Schistocerca nitens]|uniref:uncharacterized protein LOC126260685 n=1 Tax=Schistocerca nitens TaxID=7011 RepID=UPI0021175E8B|nr:uncharacterized protein LOC126260685 [Schistocerca nitens]
MEDELEWYAHTGYGHFGIKKYMSYMNKFYYFKKLGHKIASLIRTCETCQKVKENNTHVKYRMYPIIQCWSKYVKLFPIKRANTWTVIHCLQQYFLEVGKPKLFLMDNGPQFVSNKFREFQAWEGIRQVLI